MMKKAPTLIDRLYRESFRNETNSGWTSNLVWRDAFRRARKFVLDDDMSTFLGELATRAFVAKDSLGNTERVVKVRNRKAEHLRMGARLPSEITWIEYNLRNSMRRVNEILERDGAKAEEMPEREGWLLMRHPKIETAFMALIVSHDTQWLTQDIHDIWTFPLALAWTVDQDTVLPWRMAPFGKEGATPSEVSTGLIGYQTDRCGFALSDMIVTPNAPKAISDLLREWAGVQRRMWALLSTINDLPVVVKEVRQSKGFVAKGEYRRFLDHKTVTLTVPTTQYTKVARNALAMAHRRGGPVREHWRKDWRNPLSPLCDHDWGADEKHMFCTRCHGRKIWIIEHVRGNTAVGFVTRDYRVTHDPQ